MENISVFGIAIIVLIVFAVIVVSRAVRTVPPGETWTVERFARAALAGSAAIAGASTSRAQFSGTARRAS